MNDPNRLIVPLDEEYVTFAAYLWKKDPAEVWGILSRAIQNQELTNPVPFHTFQSYIRSKLPPAEIPQQQAQSRHTEEKNFFSTASDVVYGVGGLAALLYSLYVLGNLLGWRVAVVGLVIFPITYIFLPFYLFFVYGDLTLLIVNYGVGFLAFALRFIGARISTTKITIASVVSTIAACFFLLIVYGIIKDLFILPVFFSSPAPTQSAPVVISKPPTSTPRPRPRPTLPTPASIGHRSPPAWKDKPSASMALSPTTPKTGRMK
jgi:hypothetical protein